MVENKSSLFGIIAIIIGASGLGLGAFSVVNFQILEGSEGPQGVPGDDGQDGIDGIDGVNGINGTDGIDGINGTDGIDGINGTDGIDGINGTDGQDAPGGIIVGILNPDMGEAISGIVEIKALVYGTDSYSISIRRNSTEIATTLPYDWDTTLETDKKWYNITVIITDIATNNVSQDEVIVYVKNAADPVVIKSRVRGYLSSDSSSLNWDAESYDANNDFELGEDRFYAPRTGYYRVYAHLSIGALDGSGAYYVLLVFLIGSTFSAETQEWPTATEWCIQLSSTFWLPAGQYIWIGCATNDPGGASYQGDTDASETYFTIEEL